MSEQICPELTASNAESLAWHAEQGSPFCGIKPEALALWLRGAAKTIIALRDQIRALEEQLEQGRALDETKRKAGAILYSETLQLKADLDRWRTVAGELARQLSSAVLILDYAPGLSIDTLGYKAALAKHNQLKEGNAPQP